VFHDKHPLHIPYKIAKRIVIALVGGTVLLVGVLMIVTPGPAFVVIPVGLGILGIEFAWARVWLKKIKAKGKEFADGVSNRYRKTGPNNPPSDETPKQ
jgi:uncharacterized protein (TIGR02611 family)